MLFPNLKGSPTSGSETLLFSMSSCSLSTSFLRYSGAKSQEPKSKKMESGGIERSKIQKSKSFLYRFPSSQGLNTWGLNHLTSVEICWKGYGQLVITYLKFLAIYWVENLATWASDRSDPIANWQIEVLERLGDWMSIL